MAEEREYGVATSFDFPLIVFSSTDANFSTAVAFDVSAGDIQLSKDGSTWVLVNSTTSPAQIGLNRGTYTLDLDSTEMQFGRAVLSIIDQSSTKVWEDQNILLTTYGSTAGLHAFNRNSTGVSVDALGTGSITSTSFAASAILSTAIGDAALVAAKFGIGFLTSTGFAAGAINSTALAVGTITNTKFAAGAIDAAAIASNALTTDEIDAGVFTKMWAESTRSVTAVLVGAITSTSFGAGAINSTSIAAAALIAEKFGVGFITSTAIVDSAITEAKIATAAITSTKVAAGAIGSTQLGTDAITADKIASNALTTDEIAQGVFDKTAVEVWTESTRSITSLEVGTITSTSIEDSALTEAKFASGAISTANISTGVWGRINDEVLDVIATDLFGDPITTTSAPPISETLERKIGHLYGTYRNRFDASTSEKTFYTSTGGVAFTKAITDTGTYIELAVTT